MNKLGLIGKIFGRVVEIIVGAFLIVGVIFLILPFVAPIIIRRDDLGWMELAPLAGIGMLGIIIGILMALLVIKLFIKGRKPRNSILYLGFGLLLLVPSSIIIVAKTIMFGQGILVLEGGLLTDAIIISISISLLFGVNPFLGSVICFARAYFFWRQRKTSAIE